MAEVTWDEAPAAEHEVQWDQPADPTAGFAKAGRSFNKTFANLPLTALSTIMGTPVDLANLVNRAGLKVSNAVTGENAKPYNLRGGTQDVQNWVAGAKGVPVNDLFGAADPESDLDQTTSFIGNAALTGGRPGVAAALGQKGLQSVGAPEEVQVAGAMLAPGAARAVARAPGSLIRKSLTDEGSAARVAASEEATGSPGTVGMIGNGNAQALEHMLSKAPGGVKTIYDAVNMIHDGIRARWTGIMDNISGVRGAGVAGDAVERGAVTRNEQTKALTSNIYDEAAKRVEPGTEVSMTPYLDAITKTTKAIPDAKAMDKALKGTTQNWVETQHGALWNDILGYGLKKHEAENGPFQEVDPNDTMPTTQINPKAQHVQTTVDGDSIYRVGDTHFVYTPSTGVGAVIAGPGHVGELIQPVAPRIGHEDTLVLPDGRTVLKSEVQPVLDSIKAKPVLPYAAADGIHRRIGQELNDPSLLSRGIDDGIVKQIWGGSKDGIESALEGSAAGRLLGMANDFYMQKNAERQLVNPILTSAKTGGPEAIFNASRESAGANGSGTRFRELFSSAGPEGRPVVVATLLDHMGKFDEGLTTHTQDAKWSPSTFINNWGKLNSDAKTAISSQLGPEYAANLDALDKWNSDIVRGRAMYGNPSQTASAGVHLKTAASAASGVMLMLAGIGTGNHALMGAGAIGIGGATMTVAGARMTSGLMTNPNFVRWLVQTTKAPPSAIGPAIMQLGAIAKQTGDQNLQQAAGFMQAQLGGQNGLQQQPGQNPGP